MIRYIILFFFVVSMTSCWNKSQERPKVSDQIETNQSEEEHQSLAKDDTEISINPPTSKTDNTLENQKEIPNEKVKPKRPKKQEQPRAKTPQSPQTTQSMDFTTDYLMGKFNPRKHPDFTRIAPKYASNGGMLMRKDAYNSFIKMYEAAKKDGISLRIISAVRPFAHQKRIWEAKWTGKRQVDGKMLSKEVKEGAAQRALKILRWSSMPGTSRHHWGTDIDLNDLNNRYFEQGSGAKVYQWLTENASTYGFCQVYSPLGKERPNGYQEEKWHWSYLPVSKKLTELYKTQIQNKDISGFEGSESAELINIVDKYVLGINQDCQ